MMRASSTANRADRAPNKRAGLIRRKWASHRRSLNFNPGRPMDKRSITLNLSVIKRLQAEMTIIELLA